MTKNKTARDSNVNNSEETPSRKLLEGFNYISRRNRKEGKAWLAENPTAGKGKNLNLGGKKKNKNVVALQAFAEAIVPETHEDSDGNQLDKMPSAKELGFLKFLKCAFRDPGKSAPQDCRKIHQYYSREVPFSNAQRRLYNAKFRLAEIAETLDQITKRDYGAETKFMDQLTVAERRNVVASFQNIHPGEFEWLRLIVLEACFSHPEYGGNKKYKAWDSIGFDLLWVARK